MRTAADLADAADRAGLTLDWVEEVPIAGGGTELAGHMTFTDPWAAARLLVDLSEQDASDPFVQAWAYEMLGSTADAIGLPQGPTVTPELRDAVAETIQNNVRDQILFVHEPLEKFQSARTTMRTRQGDCDCHARLVFALARALGIPTEIVFFEGWDETEQAMVPVHAVTRLQDSAGNWQWAETTIPAAYGEEPFAALERVGAELAPEQNPFVGVQGIGGMLGFVTPSDVQSRKDELNATVDSIDADVVNCAAKPGSALDTGTLSAWNEFLATWRTFYAVEVGFFNAGGQARQASDYADQILKWQTKLAAVCPLTAPQLAAEPVGNVLSAVKLVVVGASIVAVALAVREVAKVGR